MSHTDPQHDFFIREYVLQFEGQFFDAAGHDVDCIECWCHTSTFLASGLMPKARMVTWRRGIVACFGLQTCRPEGRLAG
jgi:hypothetical protein